MADFVMDPLVAGKDVGITVRWQNTGNSAAEVEGDVTISISQFPWRPKGTKLFSYGKLTVAPHSTRKKLFVGLIKELDDKVIESMKRGNLYLVFYGDLTYKTL